MKDLVVCITDSWQNVSNHPNPPSPIKGEIYTVRSITQDLRGDPAYRLMEFFEGQWFSASAFRPVTNVFGEEVCARIEARREAIEKEIGPFQI